VTFDAKADAEGVTEAVKTFIEEYNALVKEINTQVTTKPNRSIGPLTDEQKDEMDETSIKNWEKKAKTGLLFNDGVMRDLSMDMQSIITKLLGSNAKYEDLEAMGITISDDYKDGGTIKFDERKFKQAMETDPDKVSDIFTGGGEVKKGLMTILDETFTPYATKYASKNGNSYGRLIEEAGSEKIPMSLTNNQIYKQLKEMEENLDKLQLRLKSEQDRYITQFASMEKLISQMNSQSSFLSQLSV
jgi:flagellar hook-associated protein 2